MDFKYMTLHSNYDNLPLSVAYIEPMNKPLGIIQFSHGMAEHKQRYYDFMYYLANRGYICVIHDHRGHGLSVKVRDDLGYFYTNDENAIVDDLYQVTVFMKEKFPNLPVILFGHSMGSLVARCYLKKYDNEIDKLILCGVPTKNSAASMALALAHHSAKVKGDQYRNHFINALAFYSYQKKFNSKHGWLSRDKSVAKGFAQDPLCGLIFTNSGFINLFSMMKTCFNKKGWALKNKEIPIMIIAGDDDPVIQNIKLFYHLQSFLHKVGYKNIETKLYPGCRHELLNELNKKEVYKDVLRFVGS